MSNLLAGGTARAYELATRKETPMQAHPKRLLAIVFTLALVGGASPVWSASPTMSTFPGSGACGIPGFDLCEPVVDVFVNFPTAPPIPIPGPSFGLVPGDVITSFSWGLDLLGGPGDSIHFSVAAGSLGALLTGVAAEAGTADQAGDIYFGGTIGVPAANVLAVDGNGLPAAAPPASGLPEPGDELSALASCDALTGPLLAGGFAFFTLAPGSPSLGSIPCPTCTPADILVAPSGGPPLLAVAGGALGLVPGDVIDALAFDGGPGILFSLAPGSPSLTGPPFPSDILGGGPVIAVAGAAIGLLPGDDLDALDIAPDGDADLVNDA